MADLSDADLVLRSRAVEAMRRRAEADQVEIMSEIERRQLFCDDGHRDVKAWYRATHRWSSTEATACRRLGLDAPEVIEALRDGAVGVGQAHVVAIRGRIRLVVTDERGVVVHMGRLRRLFTGPMRDAVLMAATRCTHPGCEMPSGETQADHLLPHSHGGATATINGAPACGKHNRWRYATGARTMVDDAGYWRTYRSDGTEVA